MTSKKRGEDEKQNGFEVFFREHYERLAQYVGRRVPASRVDDIVSATFVVAWKKFRKVDCPSLPWLFRIASFEVKSSDRAARRGGNTLSVEVIQNRADGGGDTFDATPVLAALSKLSTSDQEILRLVHWDDLTRPEVAEVLDLTVNAVNVRYHRALSRLEQLMSPSVSSPKPEGVPQ